MGMVASPPSIFSRLSLNTSVAPPIRLSRHDTARQFNASNKPPMFFTCQLSPPREKQQPPLPYDKSVGCDTAKHFSTWPFPSQVTIFSAALHDSRSTSPQFERRSSAAASDSIDALSGGQLHLLYCSLLLALPVKTVAIIRRLKLGLVPTPKGILNEPRSP